MRPLSSLTQFEQDTVAELVKFQRDSKGQHELLICVSADGTIEIGRNKGPQNGVELPAEAGALLEQNGSIRLFHNHPQQGSLSPADWRQSNRWMGRADLIAVNSRGSIFSGASAHVPELGALLEKVNLNTLRDDGENALYAAPCHKSESWLKTATYHLVGHALNLELEAMGLVAYEAKLSEEDMELWLNCENAGFWKIITNVFKTALASCPPTSPSATSAAAPQSPANPPP